MRHPDRTAYDPTQTDIVGLRANPGIHIPTGFAGTIDDLAHLAIELAESKPEPDLTLEESPMETSITDTARMVGTRVGEAEVASERERYIIDALRDAGPHHLHDKVYGLGGDAQKKYFEVQRLEGVELPGLRSEYRRIVAARGSNPIRSQEERNLEQQLAYKLEEIATAKADLKKLQDSLEPSNDPLAKLKLQQELNRLNGIEPSGRQAIAHELGGGLISLLNNPRTLADAWRRRKEVKDDLGQTPKQQRRQDRARVSRGEAPVHGTGTERPLLDKIPLFTPKSEKDKSRSSETSYSKVARVGNVIEMDGELLVVQDIQPQLAIFTGPDGTQEVITYENGQPVPMDEISDIAVRGPGKSPKLCVTRLIPDPLNPGSVIPKRIELDVSRKEVRESIHKGEDWVTMAQLYTPEDAEQTLLEGAEAYELSPICIRLDDIVFGLNGDPNRRGKPLEEKDRIFALQTHLIWQDLGLDTDGRPKISRPETTIPVFDGHNGHFVRPFSYPEHRKQTYLNEITNSRQRAAADARKAEVRPPKDDIASHNKPYRAPKRRR